MRNVYFDILDKIMSVGKMQINKKGSIKYLTNEVLYMEPADLLDIFETHGIARKKLKTELKMFEAGITKMQKHLDTANLAVTNCGTRSKKLELITTRLMSQKTNFETLESENENVDITEVAIQLSSAELTYEAALMATGKIMQTSLMNYI